MKKPKNIGIVLLFAFMGILAMPLLSAPAAPPLDHNKSNLIFFENGDEHTSQWLIRSVSESEEFNLRSEASNSNSVVLFNYCINFHSIVHTVRFAQTKEQMDIKVPKERLYLINSLFTI